MGQINKNAHWTKHSYLIFHLIFSLDERPEPSNLNVYSTVQLPYSGHPPDRELLAVPENRLQCKTS